ncbi:MAG: hypothetical protein US94_C0008G0007 [Berkelbacteria bacterium GW2011_GWB1_38_5]|uniref:Prepilin-type N-terminal cleavage/methylation domain-containing protein n=2 Tax=Candidatus Berkelbacteria TaxID=1618330 RepID=A0A0G0LRK0_9BACT|nr:MAG: hypothetical protein US94_C0008G0007 [Berkelbacteria bacterium GW2011_GWB1_38_5]KKQ90590.1 MAG: hypothetical protein UT15_C0009G0021 [Berkelbacteria bacterium GW2011_GWA1_39_10]
MKKGYTLIELLIVIAVLMILVGFSSLGIVSYSKASDVDSSKTIVVQALLEAQANSMAEVDDKAWGVHLENNRVVIFADSGTGFIEGAVGNQNKTLANNTAASWSLVSGGAEVLFSKRIGKTSNSGSITISGASPNDIMIEINSEGRINY